MTTLPYLFIDHNKKNGKILQSTNETDLQDLPVPIFCPMCSFAMSSVEDILTFKSAKNINLAVCEQCDLHWCHGLNRQKVEQGLLPKSFENEKWEEYMKMRVNKKTPFIFC
jgi:hypothetical protein